MPKIKRETALEAESKKASLEKYAPVVAAKSLFHHCKSDCHYNSFWTDLQNSQKDRYKTS
jgi:hypothetical protein